MLVLMQSQVTPSNRSLTKIHTATPAWRNVELALDLYILLISDCLQPLSCPKTNRQVRHRAVIARAVPMGGSWWCIDQIANIYRLWFAPLIAHPSRAHGDPQDLPLLVRMPEGSRARRESDVCHGDIGVDVYHVKIDIAAVEGGEILDGGTTFLARVADDDGGWHGG